MPIGPTPQWVLSGEAARILGVSRDTLIKLSNKGSIPCWRPAGAQRRWDREALLRIRDEARGVTS